MGPGPGRRAQFEVPGTSSPLLAGARRGRVPGRHRAARHRAPASRWRRSSRRDSDGYLLVATQRDPITESPVLGRPLSRRQRWSASCESSTRRRDAKQALVVGMARVKPPDRAHQFTEPALRTSYDPLPRDRREPRPEIDVLWQRVVDLAQRVIDLREDLPDDWKEFVAGIPTPGLLADLIASNAAPVARGEGEPCSRTTTPYARWSGVEDHLEREVTIAETQRTLRDEAESEESDPRRREQMLRRRMREIQEELGEAIPAFAKSRKSAKKSRRDRAARGGPLDAGRARAEAPGLDLPQHAPDRHLIRGPTSSGSPNLPWSTGNRRPCSTCHARPRVLDEDHHGLEKVKDRILEYPFAVSQARARRQEPDSLCFVGRPAWARLRLADRSRAPWNGELCTGIPGRRSRRGRDPRPPAHLRGCHARPNSAKPEDVPGSRNPIFLLDEIDKLGADFRGDPSSALLEVLDPEQNHTFSDHYIEVPFDLSSRNVHRDCEHPLHRPAPPCSIAWR